ncbi:MAG TPA: sigma-70 family RNA polymerase sigma factor, partial [Polyangia bacterium]
MGLLEEDLIAQTTWLRRLAMALVRDRDLAEDLVQDTWVAAFRHKPQIEGSARPWLATVIRNLARSRARQTRRQRLREERVTPEELLPSSEALALRYEALRVLGEMVADLPEPYRSTVLLCYGEGITPSEIARRTDVPPGTVRRRLKEGLDRIRAKLQDKQGPQWRSALLLVAVPVRTTMTTGAEGPEVAASDGGLSTGAPVPRTGVVGSVGASAVPFNLTALGMLLLAVVMSVALVRGRLGRDSAVAPIATSGSTAARTEGVVPRLVGTSVAPAAQPSLEALLAWTAQPGVAPRRVAGTVTFAGQPVPGARVLIATQALFRGSRPAEEARSGADGRFDFGMRPAGEYWVAAVAPGHAMEYIAADLRNPIARPASDQLVLALGTCEHQIAGRIVDPTGGPIVGAEVRLYGLFSVRSDADGRYEMCTPPGRVEVQVQAAGYGTVAVNTLAAARVVRDIPLLPQVVVGGKVERAAGGEPVVGALVTARSSLGRESERYTPRLSSITDAEGRFSFTGLQPGRWLISASGDGLGESDVIERVLSVGAASEPLTLQVSPLSSRRGRLLANGLPLVGVSLRAAAKHGTARSAVAVTQTDGSFVLDRVPPGVVEYDIVGYSPARIEETGDLLTLHVRPHGRVRGRVLRDGQPVAYAQIRVSGGREDATAMSRPDGTFEVTDLMAGTYRLDAFDDRSARAARGLTFSLAAAEQRDGVEVRLELAGQIAGRLTDQEGRPISSALVRFARVSNDAANALLPEPKPCATDVAGNFNCTMLAPGSYRPAISLASYARAPLSPARGSWPVLNIEDGAAPLAGVTLVAEVAGASLEGQVIDESGQPLADAQIEAEPEAGFTGFRAGQPRPRAFSDGRGQFRFATMPAGRYALRARAPSGAEAVVRGIEAGGAPATMLARSPGSLEGVLSGFGERPDVRVESVSTGERIGAELRGDARFSATGLPPGKYLV